MEPPHILPPFDGLSDDLAPLLGLPGRVLDSHGARAAANLCGALAMDLKRACASPEIVGAIAPSGISAADLDAAADWMIAAAMSLGRLQ